MERHYSNCGQTIDFQKTYYELAGLWYNTKRLSSQLKRFITSVFSKK